jgi:flagellar hook protein FlgE
VTVPDPQGADAFTRACNFTINAQGYLVTQQGDYLLGSKDGAPAYLKIDEGGANLSISATGEVTFLPPGGGDRVSAGFLTLAKFANEGGLERASTNLWRVSPASGNEVLGDQGGLPGTSGLGNTVSGVVEMSNVDLATEFTELISAQRGFQANGRVITTSDQMLEELVNLKR